MLIVQVVSKIKIAVTKIKIAVPKIKILISKIEIVVPNKCTRNIVGIYIAKILLNQRIKYLFNLLFFVRVLSSSIQKIKQKIAVARGCFVLFKVYHASAKKKSWCLKIPKKSCLWDLFIHILTPKNHSPPNLLMAPKSIFLIFTQKYHYIYFYFKKLTW